MTREEREDTIDTIQSILNKYEEDECLVTEITIGDEEIKAFKMAIKALEQEPRKGHWITVSDEETLYCSECNLRLDDEQTYIPLHYCSNCGAEMNEVEE